MPEFSVADRIWNRACRREVSDLLVGDRALAAMILAHSLVMNGGVEHAIECLSTDQLAAAKAGFRFFDLGDVVALLDVAGSSLGDGDDAASLAQALDAHYRTLIPDDSFLVEQFKAVLRRDPSAFAVP